MAGSRKKVLSVEEKIGAMKKIIKDEGKNALDVIVSAEKTDKNLFFRKGLFIKFMLENENYKKFTKKELDLLNFNPQDYGVKKRVKYLSENLDDISSEMKKEVESGEFKEIMKEVGAEDLDKQVIEYLDNDDNKKQLLRLLKNLDMIFNYISISKPKENLDYIQIPLELQKEQTCVTSLRISRKVLERFNDFCMSHKRYTKVDYLNYALVELMDKIENLEK